MDFAKYAKARSKNKKLSLQIFTQEKLAELTPQERETVNTLLKLTFGKKINEKDDVKAVAALGKLEKNYYKIMLFTTILAKLQKSI